MRTKRFRSMQTTEVRTFYTGPSGRHAVYDVVELIRDGESTRYMRRRAEARSGGALQNDAYGQRVVYL